MSFEITPKAERFMRMMVMTDGGPGAGFRLAVSPGGCSGLNADMSVRAEPEAGDGVIQRNGFRLFVPAESRILLDGVTIDFIDSVAETKLVFHDPKSTCCTTH